MTTSDIGAFAEVIAHVKINEFGAQENLESLIQDEAEDLTKSILSPQTRFCVVEQDSQILGGGGIAPIETAAQALYSQSGFTPLSQSLKTDSPHYCDRWIRDL